MLKSSRTLLRIMLGISLLLSTWPSAQAVSLEENVVLAALSLNIVRFTTWPDDAQKRMNDTIDFCVVGDNVVQQSFASIDHKAVGKKTLRIINLARLSNFEQCQALFISDLKQNILLQVFAEIKNLALLTIGSSDNFAEQGGMVGLKNVDNRMSLYVNVAAIQSANLTISSRLLSLAKIIDQK